MSSIYFVDSVSDDGSISRNMLPVLQIDNKLFVRFRLNIIFYFTFVLDNTTGWPNKKMKISIYCKTNDVS